MAESEMKNTDEFVLFGMTPHFFVFDASQKERIPSRSVGIDSMYVDNPRKEGYRSLTIEPAICSAMKGNHLPNQKKSNEAIQRKHYSWIHFDKGFHFDNQRSNSVCMS